MKLADFVSVGYNWVDIVGLVLLCVVPIGLALHFTGNILTGRFRKRFILGNWPHHDKPYKPLPRRLMHLIHVICMVGLAITGFYVHFPFFDANRVLIKYLHYVFAFVVGVNYIGRVWWAFFSDYPDYDEFGLTWREIKTVPAVIKYYIFLADSKPHLADFNPMQKFTYLSFAAVMPIIGLTGISLIFGQWILPPVAGLFGDLPTTKLVLRFIHYLCNWFFVIFTVVHAYLAVSEDLPAFLYFFFNIEPKHHDDHGHGGHEEHGVSAGHGSHEASPLHETAAPYASAGHDVYPEGGHV